MTLADFMQPAEEAQACTKVDAAILAMCLAVTTIPTQRVAWQQAAGRVLAEPVTLDRPSPACDVSAMDGYALRADDMAMALLPVSGEVQAGQPAPDLAEHTAIRVFTGAMVPSQADLVVPREQVGERLQSIRLPEHLAWRNGQHIRRRGENGHAGEMICRQGQVLTAPVLAAAASCGQSQVSVHRKVRVGLLVTGDEVLWPHDQPEPWQVRDGNGPALVGLLQGRPWLEPLEPVHVADQSDALRAALVQQLESCDALLVTGGVSAGDYDFVPAMLRKIGAHILFHKLPIRPGKPVLGAVSKQGCPILALPGNPVSTMITARRLAMPFLRWRAGITHDCEPQTWVELADSAQAPPTLTWFPLARLTTPGRASLVQGQGSGDWVSAAVSDGFVEIPPGQAATGWRRFFSWNV